MECLRVSWPQGEVPADTPFPTLKIADAVKGVFGIEPSEKEPLKMLSKPDAVRFPQVTVKGDMLCYCGSTDSPSQAKPTQRSALENELRTLGVMILDKEDKG